MAKDKGEGEGTKPSSEAKDVAKIQDDTVKTREAKAKDISSFQPSKKEVSLSLRHTRKKLLRLCRGPTFFDKFSSSLLDCHEYHINCYPCTKA